MIKVAITGSRGFLGKHLVSRLKNTYNSIKIIEINFDLGYDLLDKDSLNSIKFFDVLIHLAAKSYVPDSFRNPRSFYKTNVLGTLNALELCRKFNAKMIFTSSYVYGSPIYLPINEVHPLRAFNPYAQSKLIAEDLCHAYNRDFDIPSVIFRPFNIYGKGQKEHFLIQSIINQAKTGKIMLKDSRPKRDYIYIDDIVSAYIKAINYSFNGVEVFNLGSGVSTSIKGLTKIFLKNIDNDFTIKFSEERRKNEVLETLADIKKAQNLLEWEPLISIDEGISRIIKEDKCQ